MKDELTSTIYNWLQANGIPVEYKDGTGSSYVLSIPIEHHEEVKRLLNELAAEKESMEVCDLDEDALNHGEE